jgi:glycosyltransferase involved in cell wall biosynthesis
MPWPAPESLSVVVCAYTDLRWSELTACIASLRAQDRVPDEIILVIDHNDHLLERARDAFSDVAFSDVLVAPNAKTRGLSGARNTGTELANGDVIAFVDDDAVVAPGWPRRLLSHYGPAVAGVGGAAHAVWPADAPRWLPPEFYWVVGCSWTGLPTSVAPVRNLIGANMSLRRVALEGVGAFNAAVGRVGTKPVGCEETELCIRVRQRFPGAQFLYDPDLVVDHYLTTDRSRPRYFVHRCWSEGRSKALVTATVGTDAGLEAERRHAFSIIPTALAGAARDITRRQRGAWGRALALTGGLAVTSAGFAFGRASALRRA